jgi:16S rRNA processing protein RimM
LDYLRVGKIVNTQGLRGEVRVISQTDSPNERYKIGNQLTLFQDKKDHIVLIVKSYRKHKNFDILSFDNHSSINDVEKYREGILKVPVATLQLLPENEFYYYEIIGLKVQTIDGKEIGKIKEIFAQKANDVWVVQLKNKKEILVPYIESVVKKIDLTNDIVIIEWMEGLA